MRSLPLRLGSWLALVAGWLALLVAIHQPGKLSLEVAAEAGAVEALGVHVTPVEAGEAVGEVREALLHGEGEGPPSGRRPVLVGAVEVSRLFSEAIRALHQGRPRVTPAPPAAPTLRVSWYAHAPAPARAPPSPAAA